MSALYLTASTDAIRTLRTARAHHWAWAALRSFDGSIRVGLNAEGFVSIYAAPGSTTDPAHLLGTFKLADLLEPGTKLVKAHPPEVEG